jgi:hypothetical protein
LHFNTKKVDFPLVDGARNPDFYHYCYNFLETKAAGNLIFSEVNNHLSTSKTKKLIIKIGSVKLDL